MDYQGRKTSTGLEDRDLGMVVGTIMGMVVGTVMGMVGYERHGLV